MEKEYIWKFPDDFEGEIAKNSNLKFLNDHSVSGEVYTKATPLKKSECGFYCMLEKISFGISIL